MLWLHQSWKADFTVNKTVSANREHMARGTDAQALPGFWLPGLV